MLTLFRNPRLRLLWWASALTPFAAWGVWGEHDWWQASIAVAAYLAVTLGAIVGLTFVRWERRFNVETLNAIELFCAWALFPLLLQGVVTLLLALYTPGHASFLLAAAAFVALVAVRRVRPCKYLSHGTRDRPLRCALRISAAVLAIEILASESALVSAATGRFPCQIPRVCGWIGGRRATPGLMVALTDSDEAVRLQAVVWLSATGDARAVPALIAALNDSERRVREHAAWALCGIGDRRAVPALIAALNDSSRDTRAAAAVALGIIGDKRASPALAAAVYDDDWGVRLFSARALARLGDNRGVPVLMSAVRIAPHSIRRLAAEALGLLGDRRVVRELKEVNRRHHAGCLSAEIHPLDHPLPPMDCAEADCPFCKALRQLGAK